MTKEPKKSWYDADQSDEEYNDEYENASYNTNRGHYNSNGTKPNKRASIKKQLNNEFKKYLNN